VRPAVQQWEKVRRGIARKVFFLRRDTSGFNKMLRHKVLRGPALNTKGGGGGEGSRFHVPPKARLTDDAGRKKLEIKT